MGEPHPNVSVWGPAQSPLLLCGERLYPGAGMEIPHWFVIGASPIPGLPFSSFLNIVYYLLVTFSEEMTSGETSRVPEEGHAFTGVREKGPI